MCISGGKKCYFFWKFCVCTKWLIPNKNARLKRLIHLNTFHVTCLYTPCLFLYSLKNSNFFRGCRKISISWNGLNWRMKPAEYVNGYYFDLFTVNSENDRLNDVVNFEEVSACYQGLFYQFIACDSRTQSPALLQNIFKFCIFLPQFSGTLPFFSPFLALFLKKRTHALTF